MVLRNFKNYSKGGEKMARANSIKKNYNFVDYELMIEILGKKIQERRNEKVMTLNMLATY